MNNNIKLIVLDLDNTLLKDNKTISTKDKTTLKKVINNGIEVIFASGRFKFALDDILQTLDLKFNQNVIADGGGTVYDNERIIHLDPFSKKEYLKVLDYLRNQDIIPFVTDGEFIYYETEGPLIKMYQKLINKYPHYFIKTSNLETLDHILKFLVYSPDENLNKLKKLDINGIKSFISAKNLAEITKSSLDKWTAIQIILKDLNLSYENVCAIGDSGNDVEMIKKAGIGLAVSNALEEVKEVADYVSEKDNNHSAVSELIEKYIFNEI